MLRLLFVLSWLLSVRLVFGMKMLVFGVMLMIELLFLGMCVEVIGVMCIVVKVGLLLVIGDNVG